MSRKFYGYIGLIVLLIFIAVLIIYKRESNSPGTFSLEEFKEEMSDKGYVFEIQDAKEDFLKTPRKRLIMEDIEIDMYLFRNDKDMEKEASHIDSDGSGYSKGLMRVKVSWISTPHFYKRGSLIVQYVGNDESIISSLEAILGQQFAGYK